MSTTKGGAVKLNEKGERVIENVKVTRYRSGVVPKFISEQSNTDQRTLEKVKDRVIDSPLRSATVDPVIDLNVSSVVDIKQSNLIAADRRIARLQTSDDRSANVVPRRKAIEHVDVAPFSVNSNSLADRRARLTAVSAKVEPIPSNLPQMAESDNSDGEESDESDVSPIIKPVFIPKSDRKKLESKAVLAEVHNDEHLKENESRRQETLQIISQVMKREAESESSLQQSKDIFDINSVDDSDMLNDPDEYDAWKIRELLRLKRDKEERERIVALKEESEQLRNATEEERNAIMSEREAKRPEKGQMRFMQRYHHRGAFYQDLDEEIYKRDITAPTGEDRIDKSLLPEVMQVKRFGFKNRTKWTHLTNEDTSRPDAGWYVKSDVNQRSILKQGGMKEDRKR